MYICCQDLWSVAAALLASLGVCLMAGPVQLTDGQVTPPGVGQGRFWRFAPLQRHIRLIGPASGFT